MCVKLVFLKENEYENMENKYVDEDEERKRQLVINEL